MYSHARPEITVLKFTICFYGMPHLLFLHPPFTGDMGTHYTQLSMNPVEVFLETEREGRREGVSGWTRTRDAAATGQRLKGATCKMVY